MEVKTWTSLIRDQKHALLQVEVKNLLVESLYLEIGLWQDLGKQDAKVEVV